MRALTVVRALPVGVASAHEVVRADDGTAVNPELLERLLEESAPTRVRAASSFAGIPSARIAFWSFASTSGAG